MRYCLNTSTIKGQNLTLVEEIDIASKAGYDSIEPWIAEIDAYVGSGGSLPELRRRIEDAGLTVENAIGFFEWIVDDPEKRARGLDEARRNMELLARIGGKRLAAPPFGAVDRTDIDLLAAAERYRALIEAGADTGVVPVVEMWGFSKTLGRLGEAVLVAMESGHPDAAVLADAYHLYKGGSSLEGLCLLGAKTIAVFHINDYPAEPARAEIKDEHRVYPGDGIAPLGRIFRSLRLSGFDGVVSLELFNREYWRQDALSVAKTGREKMAIAING